MTLSDLERRVTQGVNFFLADLRNYARTVWLGMSKFGIVTQRVSAGVSRAQ